MICWMRGASWRASLAPAEMTVMPTVGFTSEESSVLSRFSMMAKLRGLVAIMRVLVRESAWTVSWSSSRMFSLRTWSWKRSSRTPETRSAEAKRSG